MIKVFVLLLSVVSIGCTSFGEDRNVASQKNSDFTKEYQQKLNQSSKTEVESASDWEEHKKFLRESSRGDRF